MIASRVHRVVICLDDGKRIILGEWQEGFAQLAHRKEDQVENLIADIYEALEDDAVLEALPDLIAQELGSRSCTLQLFSSDFFLEEMWVNHFNNEMADFYSENNLQLHDAWTQTNLSQFVPNRAERHSDFLPAGEFCNSLFYNEFIRRFGDDSAHCMGFSASRPDGGRVLLGLQKARRDEDFTDKQVASLQRIQPHVTRMAVLRQKRVCRENAAAGALAGINSIEDAYLLVRPNRHIVFANLAAEILLEKANLLKSKGDKLSFVDHRSDQNLARMLADASSYQLDCCLSFLASDTFGGSWRIAITPRIYKNQTCLSIWFNRGQVSCSAPEMLQQLYGLTNAELPILLKIGEGMSANEIAERQGVSVATVRTHLQHIYTKTGVNKASQLAALAASLPKVGT